jgi:MoaA/NifB/PqqE/SkfB family radical SAM enzyme
MTFYKNIVEIEIENSSICNAACPACAREQTPGDYEWLTERFLDVEFFEERIPDSVYAGLKRILFTGTVGDPCTAPNFLEVIQTVRAKAPDVMISIATNGGMKSADWWARLAVALGSNSEITFAIDGLADTNDIYRVNVKWNKVLENAKAFINASGRARWQYIVFEHNQHQVDSAQELAKELGFDSFVIKPSHRFKVDEFLGVEGRYGRDNVAIKPPTLEQFVHKVMIVKKEDYVRPGAPEWWANSDHTQISCYVKESSTVYIDHFGRVLPCCFLSGGVFVRRDNKYPDGWDQLWQEHGDRKVNLHYQSWDSIMDSEFFKGIEASWTKSYAEGRLLTCAGTCSEFNGRLNDAESFSTNKTIRFN